MMSSTNMMAQVIPENDGLSSRAKFNTFSTISDYAPEKGSFSTEVQFNPFGQNKNHFSLDGLKFRYYISDNDALRLNIGINMTNDKNTVEDVLNNKFPSSLDNYNVTNGTTETISKKTTFRIGVGYERLLVTRDRLNIYAGGEVGYEGEFYSGEKNISHSQESFSQYKSGSYSSSTLQTINYTDNIEYKKMNPGGATNTNSIFVNAFTGVDFYIYDGLYIGTELGIRFSTGKSAVNGTSTETYSYNEKTTNSSSSSSSKTTSLQKNWTKSSETGLKIGTEISTDSSGKVTQKEINEATIASDNSTSFTRLKVYIEPCIRLGWRF